MEVRRVEGRNLIENIVYNIYKNEGNVNIGVCLVIAVNNGNNRTKIKLRKLIGNDELSLNKSEIYGKNPVNLTGADLTGADLTGADLTGADLTGADLTGADLTGAHLTDSNLTGAVLTGATLTDANISFSNFILSNLTDANLTSANLFLTDLTDANLIGANLTHSELIDSTLTDAIISRNSLSGYQIENIFGKPKYIEDLREEQLRQEILRQEILRQELLRQQRINLNSNSNNNNILNLQQLTLEQLRELIIGRPIQNTNNSNYISQVQRLTRRQQLAIQRPPVQQVLSFNSNNENNQIPIQQQRETPITIPENLLNPVKNSNNSCPNFNGLYEFIMRQNLSGVFFLYMKVQIVV